MKKILTICFAVIALSSARAQTIDSAMAKFASDFASEKAWLHFDKSTYYPGESIWFKAYMMEGIFPATESKTLYVDYIGSNGTVLSHIVSPLVDGVTNGQFDIPANYTGNFLQVRAYTKWMLNFDTAFLFSKNIRIIGKATTAKTTAPVIVPTLTFFPEGGDAIANVLSKIAFKATDQWGRPVRVKGVIQDSKGTTIDSLRPLHDGMGFFVFTPDAAMKYTARWKDEKGKEYISPLPPIKTTGVAMQVSVSGIKRIITLNYADPLPDDLKQLHLVGTMNQIMVFKNDVTAGGNNGLRRVIETKGLPSGVMTITLFDAGWNAIAERITFINNDDYSFEPSMEVMHWGLSKRKRNEVQITIPDSLKDASLSVSVTDAAIEKDTANNIISHFLLTSEIKGQVYNPAYYFARKDDSAAQHLDLVMLTNGWRRFKWEDITKGKMPVINYPRDTSYLTLSGKVFGVTKSQLSGKESIVLMVKAKDSSTQMLILPITTNGTFSDPNIIFLDTLQVYYSLKSKFLGQAEARFMTDRLPTPNYTPFSKNFVAPDPFNDTSGSYHHAFLAGEEARLQQIQKGKVMETVTVTAKQKPTVAVLDEKYSSGMFKGGDGYQFDLVNDPAAVGSMNILNYLQGRVAGLQITTGGGTPSLSWRGGAPQLYLDEVQTDADMITSVPVTDIAYVKVFRPPFMGGFGGSNGAIAIYTRKGNDAQNSPAHSGLSNNKVLGYTPIRQFYSPNYDRFDVRNEQPDVRTTLYWNPLVVTKNHKATLTFYNNDVTKSFRVVIEGMTKEGLMTHYEQIME